MLLCNFSNTTYHLEFFKNGWHGLNEFLIKERLDGIELLLHGNEDISAIPKGIVKGLHLSYFPTWIDFYKGDKAYLVDYPTVEDLKFTFGGIDKSSIINRFKRDYQLAKELGVEYMVFHVGHVSIKEAYTFEFLNTNREVLRITAELVNEVFDEESTIDLLFENLWWPGLTLQDGEETQYFLDLINYKNKGILLDLSHLLLTNKRIANMDESVAYIKDVLVNLGDSIEMVKGVHINYTDASRYLNENHQDKYDRYIQSEKNEQFAQIYQHISSMDQHLPFLHKGLSEIIELINPKYQNIEVKSYDFKVWSDAIKAQRKFI